MRYLERLPFKLFLWLVFALTQAIVAIQCVPPRHGNSSPDSRHTDTLQNPFLTESEHVARAEELFSLNEYVAICQNELGPAPQLRCMDGVEIPVVLDQEGSFEKCERPSLNNPAHACVPGNRILRRTTRHKGDAVDWVMICQKILPDPKAQRFHSIDLIGHNRKTGESCFFKNSSPSERIVTIQGKTFPGFDGAQVLANLNDPAKAKEDWSMPYGTAGNCTTCHGSHPFLRTVVLSGLKTAEGQPVLPPVHRDTPYKVTAAERLRQAAGAYRATDAHPTFRGPQDLWLPRRIKTDATERTCASCHSVGPENHCEIVLGPAFGTLSSESAQVQIYERSLPTKVRSTPDLIRWHPWSQFAPNTSALEVKAAVDSLMRCCKDPRSIGCKVEPITQL